MLLWRRIPEEDPELGSWFLRKGRHQRLVQLISPELDISKWVLYALYDYHYP
jgi:hypothetical protein